VERIEEPERARIIFGITQRKHPAAVMDGQRTGAPMGDVLKIEDNDDVSVCFVVHSLFMHNHVSQ
jgi:hypothetical protein